MTSCYNYPKDCQCSLDFALCVELRFHDHGDDFDIIAIEMCLYLIYIRLGRYSYICLFASDRPDCYRYDTTPVLLEGVLLDGRREMSCLCVEFDR